MVLRRGYAIEPSQWEVVCVRCERTCPAGLADLHFPEGCERGYYTCALCTLREGVPRADWLVPLLGAFPRKRTAGGEEITPYPFQAEDALLIAQSRAKLVGSQMGTGKTPTTALGAIQPGMGVMIFCPSSVKWNWQRELVDWRPDIAPSDMNVASSKAQWALPAPGEVVIASYGLLPGEACEACRSSKKPKRAIQTCTHFEDQPNPVPVIDRPVVLIADEIHYLQNHTKRRLCWDKLRDAVWAAGGRLYGLTGTVTSNSAGDLLSILTALNLLRPSFGTSETYYHYFRSWFMGEKGSRKAPWGEERQELLQVMRPIRLCRLRKHVLKHLPPVQEKTIKVELTKATIRAVDEAVQRLLATRKAWQDVQTHVIQDPSTRGLSQDERERRRLVLQERIDMYFETRPWVTNVELRTAVEEILLTKRETPQMTELARIRALLSRAKIGAVLEIVETHEQQGEPLVTFCQHVGVLEDAFEGRAGWGLYTGKIPQKVRDGIWQDFQKGVHNYGIALSITAGGEGINLTRASAVLFVDRHFNPAKNRQARDRVLRPGAEKHDSITVYNLVADHAVDQLVVRTLREKEELADCLDDDEASMAGLDKLELDLLAMGGA